MILAGFMAETAWERLGVTLLGIAACIAGGAAILYGVTLCLLIITLPIGILFIVVGLALVVAGLAIAGVPWLARKRMAPQDAAPMVR
jgi:hypothetical protein